MSLSSSCHSPPPSPCALLSLLTVPLSHTSCSFSLKTIGTLKPSRLSGAPTKTVCFWLPFAQYVFFRNHFVREFLLHVCRLSRLCPRKQAKLSARSPHNSPDWSFSHKHESQTCLQFLLPQLLSRCFFFLAITLISTSVFPERRPEPANGRLDFTLRIEVQVCVCVCVSLKHSSQPY